MKLGILDQSIVRHNATAPEALQETIETAHLAEDLGYSRFWVSEHHNSPSIAGSAPEVLLARLAAETETIRMGSGGIMLPNHSSLKVAENFRMLEALYPGRIDLGMGRAPGGDRVSAHLLNPSNRFSEDDYIKQLDYLQLFFRDQAKTEHGAINAIPQAPTIPQQWILSSSGGSAKIAAKMGLGLSVAKFINGNVSPAVVENYRKYFEVSENFKKPQAFMSVFVVCAKTEERAKLLRKYVDYLLLQIGKGNFSKHPDVDFVKNYSFSITEQNQIEANSGRLISGTPEEVKTELTELASDFDLDELMLTTIAPEKEWRLESFKLIAEAFDLKPKPEA